MGYLRRLATTGAAYTASSILSKLIAVALLPLYTRHLTPGDYGAAEVMQAAVIAGSIVIRFGVIEALLRFYYLAGERRDAVVGTGFSVLAWSASAAAALCLALAAPISSALLGHEDAALARLAVLGLWTLTLWEFALALLRLDERARAYFALTVANVVVTIPALVWLVVIREEGANGILLGTFVTALPFLGWRLWEERRRLALLPDRGTLRRMLRFGLPTMPAELTLYSLNFIDRIIIVRSVGLAEAGLYAIAVKFASAMQVVARGFQLAFPPLAYAIRDDEEARRAYALVFTWFTAVCAFAASGLWLLAPWITRWLAAPSFFAAYKAIGLVAGGIALYALYLVLVVILGRSGRTEFSFPATAASVAVNVALNLLLVPAHGIVGAGIALLASYAVVLALMHAFTRRLFPVPYEWRRLALAVGAAAALVALGELAVPVSGAGALAARAALWLAYPLALASAGFLSAEERASAARLLRPSAVRRRLRELRAAPAGAAAGAEPELGSEVFEAAIRDEDRGA